VQTIVSEQQASCASANYCEVVSNMNPADIQVIKLSISVGNNI